MVENPISNDPKVLLILRIFEFASYDNGFSLMNLQAMIICYDKLWQWFYEELIYDFKCKLDAIRSFIIE